MQHSPDRGRGFLELHSQLNQQESSSGEPLRKTLTWRLHVKVHIYEHKYPYIYEHECIHTYMYTMHTHMPSEYNFYSLGLSSINYEVVEMNELSSIYQCVEPEQNFTSQIYLQ